MCRARVGMWPLTIEMRRDGAQMCPRKTWMRPHGARMPPLRIRMCREPAGMCPLIIEICRDNAGIRPLRIRTRHDLAGMRPLITRMCRDKAWMRPGKIRTCPLGVVARPRESAPFAPETRHEVVVAREMLGDELDRDVASPCVLGQVDDAHAALPEDGDDAVPADPRSSGQLCQALFPAASR